MSNSGHIQSITLLTEILVVAKDLLDKTAIRIGFALLLVISCGEPAAARFLCSNDTPSGYRDLLVEGIEKDRWHDVLQCVDNSGTWLLETASGLNGAEADEFRYAIAQAVSDSIAKSGIRSKQFHELAAAWWTEYLANLSEPVDARRLNFAIGKLDQHARPGNWPDHWPTIVRGLQTAANHKKVDPRIGRQVVSMLYRCSRWGIVRPPSDATVCDQHCRSYFTSFMAAVEPNFDPPPSRADRLAYGLYLDVNAVAKRLQCGQ